MQLKIHTTIPLVFLHYLLLFSPNENERHTLNQTIKIKLSLKVQQFTNSLDDFIYQNK